MPTRQENSLLSSLTSIWMKADLDGGFMVSGTQTLFCLIALPSSTSSFHLMVQDGCSSIAITSTFLPVGSREKEVEVNFFKGTNQMFCATSTLSLLAGISHMSYIAAREAGNSSH